MRQNRSLPRLHPGRSGSDRKNSYRNLPPCIHLAVLPDQLCCPFHHSMLPPTTITMCFILSLHISLTIFFNSHYECSIFKNRSTFSPTSPRKTALPATIMFAPASIASVTFSRLMPPSTSIPSLDPLSQSLPLRHALCLTYKESASVHRIPDLLS